MNNWRTFTGLGLMICHLPLAAWESPPTFGACIDYHCDYQRPVTLSSDEWQRVRLHFLPPAQSARAERRQLKAALATMEQLVGEKTVTWRDLGKNQGEGSELGQLDCIAESLNASRYLTLLAEDNLLKWHRVLQRQRRNPWFFSVHWTAAIEETGSGRRFAVDSWVNANGEPPIVQPLSDWLASSESNIEQD